MVRAIVAGAPRDWMRCLTQEAASGQTVRDERRARKGDYLKPVRTARSLRIPLLAAAAGILLAAAAMLALLQPSTGRADPAIDSFEQEFLDLLNQYRTQNGRAPLALNAQLTAAADWMSGDLAANRCFDHTDSLGRNPGERARDFGYYGGVGENIAGGYSSAQSVFAGWKASSGHNRNMLYQNYKVIGIGRIYLPGSQYGVYWTTDFGLTGNPAPAVDASTSTRVAGVSNPCPTPTTTRQPTPTPTATPQPTPTPTPTGVMPTPAPTHTPPPATPTPPAAVFGDVNCDLVVGSMDALQVLRLVALLSEQPACPSSADVDCDGRVTAVDALDILLYVVSHPAEPGPGCPPIGSLG